MYKFSPILCGPTYRPPPSRSRSSDFPHNKNDKLANDVSWMEPGPVNFSFNSSEAFCLIMCSEFDFLRNGTFMRIITMETYVGEGTIGRSGSIRYMSVCYHPTNYRIFKYRLNPNRHDTYIQDNA